MTNMRKESAGSYVIGIYSVEREGRKWVAYGRDFGFRKEFPTLAAAHLELTGEPLREPRVCQDCSGKRYRIMRRSDGRDAVERCDTCSWHGDDNTATLGDENAAKLAQADGIACASTYPCVLEPYRDPPGFEPGRVQFDKHRGNTVPRTADGKFPIYRP